MGTVELILHILFGLLNGLVVVFIVLYACRPCKRMREDLNATMRHIQHVSDRNDVVYLNQLENMKRELLQNECYEEASTVQRIINDEMKRMKKSIGRTEQNDRTVRRRTRYRSTRSNFGHRERRREYRSSSRRGFDRNN